MKQLVFVYGTLLKGERNAHWAGNAPRKSASVSGLLYDTGFGFPAIKTQKGTAKVLGEVIYTDDEGLAHMDILEGYPRLYDRKRVIATLDEGGEVEAWVYEMPIEDGGFRLIEGGNWRKYEEV